MDEEKEKEEGAAKFETERSERERLDEEKTRRKREKRQKRGKGGKKDGEGKEDGVKGKFKANVPANGAVSNGVGRKDADADAETTVPEEVGIVIHDED